MNGYICTMHSRFGSAPTVSNEFEEHISAQGWIIACLAPSQPIGLITHRENATQEMWGYSEDPEINKECIIVTIQ